MNEVTFVPLEPQLVNGVWECPVCGFKGMSKKLVQQHIEREHAQEAQQKENKEAKAKSNNKSKNKHKSKQQAQKRTFHIGKQQINIWENQVIDVRDHRGWLFFTNRNYIAPLHGEKVRVKLTNGEEFIGTAKTKDPYFLGLVLESGRKLYINKASIMIIEPLERGHPQNRTIQ